MALYVSANFATAMLSAALEIPYAMVAACPKRRTYVGEPMPEEMVKTFFVSPALSRGRKALMVCVVPTTFVLNCQ